MTNAVIISTSQIGAELCFGELAIKAAFHIVVCLYRCAEDLKLRSQA